LGVGYRVATPPFKKTLIVEKLSKTAAERKHLNGDIRHRIGTNAKGL
jgi:hypothetical protein